MSTLTKADRRQLEGLLNMKTGFVLKFSDRTFDEFFNDNFGIDIHADRYQSLGTSKANKLRTFWNDEPDGRVGSVITELLKCCEAKPEEAGDMSLLEPCRAIARRLSSCGASLDTLKSTAAKFDAGHLRVQIERAEKAVDSDPTLAIGTAKELVETCCKTILAERGVALDANPTIPTLTKAVCRELKLLADDVPEQKKGAETIRRLLSNLATITQGLAELRSLYGTGHGKDGRVKGLTPRHARLAVGAAAALATFLFQTHEATKVSTGP